MSVVESVTKFAGEHPVATAVYIGGAALSIFAHSCFKATKYHSDWKKKDMPNVPEDNRTEAAITTVMQGAAVGFVRGLVTCTIWPVEAAAVVYVLGSKESNKKQ